MFKLEQLNKLFTVDILKPYGIDATKINTWYDPLMKDFCKNINAQLPKDKQLMCELPKGCGIDDKCTLDEICISKVGGDYYCGELSQQNQKRIILRV